VGVEIPDQVYASWRPTRAGRVRAISSATPRTRTWKSFRCTIAQTAVVAARNCAPSAAWITGVRSAPR
jgi:hypothetical protein